MSADADEIAAVRKELVQVKTKAVGKIKTLQAQVEELQKQLAERPLVAPPDESSSDGSDLVKVDSPNAAALQKREAELQRREADLAEREEALQLRETVLAQQPSRGSAAPVWHAALLEGLSAIRANCQQVNLAAESVGVIGVS